MGCFVIWSVVILVMIYGFILMSWELFWDVDFINGVDDDRIRFIELIIFLLNVLMDMVKCFCWWYSKFWVYWGILMWILSWVN